jgi:hypothetical protein
MSLIFINIKSIGKIITEGNKIISEENKKYIIIPNSLSLINKNNHR